GVGGLVDPAVGVEAVGLRQHVLGPALGLRIEAHVAAGVHLAGPDLAVLVDIGGVERGIGRGQPVLDDALLLGVELHQHAAAAGAPIVAVGIELAGRRAGIGAAVGLEPLAGLGVHHHQAVARPGAAAEIAPVLAHGAAVGAGELLEHEARHVVAGERVDLGDLLLARAPEEAVGI